MTEVKKQKEEQIVCENCDCTPEDLGIEMPFSVGAYTGMEWYCSESCYEEAKNGDQMTEVKNPFDFFESSWFKDATVQLCADGWPTFIVPLNVKIRECKESYEQLQKENEKVKNSYSVLRKQLSVDFQYQEIEKLNKLLDKAVEAMSEIKYQCARTYGTDDVEVVSEKEDVWPISIILKALAEINEGRK